MKLLDSEVRMWRRVSSAFDELMVSEDLKVFAEQRMLTLLGHYGDEANAKAVAAEQAWTWMLHNLKIAVKSPADLGIAKPE